MLQNRVYIFSSLSFLAIVGILSFAGTIYFADPFNDGLLAHFSLYASVFISAVGIFTILAEGLKIYIIKFRTENHLRSSIRQGIIIGILITGSLALQSQDLLFWWVEITLILFLLAVEFFLNL